MISIKQTEGLAFVFCKVFEKINRKSDAYITLHEGNLYITSEYTCAVLFDQKFKEMKEGNYQILLSKSEKKTYMLVSDEEHSNQDVIVDRIKKAKTVLKNILVDDAHIIKTNFSEPYLAAGVSKLLNVIMADNDTAIAKLLPKFKVTKYKELPVVFDIEPINNANSDELFIIFNMQLFNNEAKQMTMDFHEEKS